MSAVVELRGVGKAYGGRRALAGVTLAIGAGEAVGICGRSGSGKSTLARILTLHEAPDEGERQVGGRPAGARPERETRRRLQLVPQEPGRSFAKGWTVERILREAIETGREGNGPKEEELLARVGLSGAILPRPGTELSGGERARVAIARALGAGPALLVLDETLSGLDGPVRRGIGEVLARLREEEGLATVVVSHNFGVLRETCRWMAVMEAGRVVEQGEAEGLLRSPEREETLELVRAAYWRGNACGS